MPYTDIWRCKKCNTLPDILMMGKNFLIECKVCQKAVPSVYGTKIHEVVNRWNRRNDPVKRNIFAGFVEWISILKDAVEYRLKRDTSSRAKKQ